MHITRIQKRPGVYRTIYCPNASEKANCHRYLPLLNQKAIDTDKHGVAHGFMPGRSIITNALAHVGDWQITLSFDFENFFDTVLDTPDLRATLDARIGTSSRQAPVFGYSDFFPDGAARQGLPTSPAIANIAAAPFDDAVMTFCAQLTPKRRLLGNKGPAFVYTRYADDLSFSCNSEAVAARLLEEIPNLATAHGFTINAAKTRRQHAKAGLRHVTGIAVSPTGIQPSREHRRKLRAASHQIKHGICRRNLRRILTKMAGKYAHGDHWHGLATTARIGDYLREQWRGLAAHCRLMPPRNPTQPQQTRTQTPTHRAAPAIPMPFGAFNRKITA
jgi:RNA-directed DNA polymerase